MTRRPRVPGTSERRVLYVLRAIDDDAPESDKNARAIRNVCATEGACPSCGSVGEIRSDPGVAGLFHAVFEHETWCPVVTDKDTA